MIIAVDFDKTLENGGYPKAKHPKLIHRIIMWYVKYKQKHGATIILNTLRKGDNLKYAVEWCHACDFFPDYVNENVPELIEKYGESRKIACDLNIDDTNIGLIGFILRNIK